MRSVLAVIASALLFGAGNVLAVDGVEAQQSSSPSPAAAAERQADEPAGPRILGVSVLQVTDQSAEITWSLDGPGTGQIQYGQTTEYGSTTDLEATFRYSTHVQDIEGLQPDTEYHFRVVSVNEAGIRVESDDNTFRTLPAPSTSEPRPEPTLVTLPAIVPPDFGPEPTGTRRVPASIDATGESKVTKALQGFIDDVPDGSRIVFPADAEYRLGKGLSLEDRHGLVFDGNGATIRTESCDEEGSVFSIGRRLPSSDIIIRDLVLVGANEDAGTDAAYDPACEFAMGVSIHGSSGIEIDGVAIRDVGGDCVYVGAAGDDWSDGVHFHDSSCTGTGRMGVAVVAGSNVHVEDVDFDEIALIVFDIEPGEPDGGARDIVFTDNTVGTVGFSDRFPPWFFAANGNLDAEVRNVTVSNNTTTGSTLGSLVGDEFQGWSGGRNHHDFTFVGNRSSVQTRGPVLYFKHVDGLTVYGNDQPLSSGDLVYVEDTVNTDIR